MVQLVVHQMLLIRYMADQGVGTEGDAHALAGQVVGCDLLVQLQTDFGQKMGIVENPVRAFPGVISAF